MKKFLLSVIVALTALVANAGLPGGIFDHLGVGVGVGTTGISVEAATPTTRWVQLRAGVAIMPSIKFHADADVTYHAAGVANDTEIQLTGDLGRVQGMAIFNVYPVPVVPFYIAVGAYFGGDKLLKITGYSEDLADYGGDIEIGDYRIPADANGKVSGGLKVKGFRPYLGIGYGKAVPGKLLNFSMDLGVQIHGKPTLYTDYGEIVTSDISDDNTFQKIIDKVKVYPTLTFRLGFRAF